MPERHPNPLFGYALGAVLGTLLWNGIFLALGWAGLLSGAWVWFLIQATYGEAFLFAGMLLAANRRVAA